MKIFMLGIGGISMSGIALYLKQMGFDVSGSDMRFTDITKNLQKNNIKVYDESHDITPYDLIIYTSAVKNTHPQFAKAIKLKKNIIRRAEVLSQLAMQGTQLAIAGTHGKTSSTSMLAHILQVCNKKPTAFIGGVCTNFNTNIVVGDSKYMVLEADEYDRSFLALNPINLAILGIEPDHLDIYKDINDIVATFQQLVDKIPFYGNLFLNFESELCKKIKAKCKVITFGFDKKADLHAKLIENKNFSTKSAVYLSKKYLGELNLRCLGKYNISNALAAIGIAMQTGINFSDAVSALKSYLGVKRRFEFLGKFKNACFYDDYAHHPTEIEFTLKAVKNTCKSRVIAIFEPHLFSRTKDFYKDFAKALSIADEVLLMPIYPAREKPILNVSSKLIFDELQIINKNIKNNLLKSKEDLFFELDKIVENNDIVITLGAGTVTYFGREYLKLKNANKKND